MPSWLFSSCCQRVSVPAKRPPPTDAPPPHLHGALSPHTFMMPAFFPIRSPRSIPGLLGKPPKRIATWGHGDDAEVHKHQRSRPKKRTRVGSVGSSISRSISRSTHGGRRLRVPDKLETDSRKANLSLSLSLSLSPRACALLRAMYQGSSWHYCRRAVNTYSPPARNGGPHPCFFYLR